MNYPTADTSKIDDEIEKEFEFIKNIVESIRSIKTSKNKCDIIIEIL